MRACVGTLFALLLLGIAGGGHKAVAQAPGCAKSDFESVVNEAGSVLRDLNRQNTPVFQAKLRALKEKRNWGNDEFLKQAEPFVRDERIVGYDQKSGRCSSGSPAAARPARQPSKQTAVCWLSCVQHSGCFSKRRKKSGPI
jgi:hypothetical protein